MLDSGGALYTLVVRLGDAKRCELVREESVKANDRQWCSSMDTVVHGHAL